jgi:hypothetical protein
MGDDNIDARSEEDSNDDGVGERSGVERTMFELGESDLIGDSVDARSNSNSEVVGDSIGCENIISDVDESNTIGDRDNARLLPNITEPDDLELATGAKMIDGVLVTAIEELEGVDEELEDKGTTIEKRPVLLNIEVIDELAILGKEVGIIGGRFCCEDRAVLLGVLKSNIEPCEERSLLEIGAAAREFDDMLVKEVTVDDRESATSQSPYSPWHLSGLQKSTVISKYL